MGYPVSTVIPCIMVQGDLEKLGQFPQENLKGLTNLKVNIYLIMCNE